MPFQSVGRWMAEYVALVGVPLLGILGVLLAGRHLQAAAPVDGRWILQLDQPLAAADCLEAAPSGKLILTVQQSGAYLAGRLRSLDGTRTVTLDGSLDGNRLVMIGTGDCVDALQIRATVGEGRPAAAPLQGELEQPACPACPIRRFAGNALKSVPTLIPEESR